MNKNIGEYKSDNKFERFDRENDIQIGQYYRFEPSEEESKSDDKYFTINNIYIVTSLKYNEITNQLHSVTLYIPAHDSRHSNGSEVRIIANDFFLQFTYVSADVADEERKVLLKKFENETNLVKLDMEKALKSPQDIFEMISNSTDEKVVESRNKINIELRLPSPENMVNDASKIISNSAGQNIDQVKGQLENQIALAETAQIFVKQKSTELSAILNNSTSVMMEKSKAIIGKSNEMMEQVKSVISKVDTISLYLGKDVHVDTLIDGNESTSCEPISLFSHKIFADEEMLTFEVFSGGDFDHLNMKDFFKELTESKNFLNTIVPLERSIVCVQARRSEKHYSEHPLTNHIMNLENFSACLLVRDGDRVSVITSPIDYQDRLFPTQAEMDSRLEGMSADDVRLTDAQKSFKALENTYSKITAILQGVLDRQDTGDIIVFGKLPANKFGASFFESSLAEKNFNFINDEDFLLGGNPLTGNGSKWIREKNISTFEKGEYIIYDTNDIDQYNSPNMYQESRMGDIFRRWDLKRDSNLLNTNVFFFKKKPCVKIVATKENRDYNLIEKNFNVYIKDAFSLMKIKPSELTFLMKSRAERRYIAGDYNYLMKAKRAIDNIQEKAKYIYQYLNSSLTDLDSDGVHLLVMDWARNNYKLLESEISDKDSLKIAGKISSIYKSSVNINDELLKIVENYTKDKTPLFIVSQDANLFLVTDGTKNLQAQGVCIQQDLESETKYPVAFGLHKFKDGNFTFTKYISSDFFNYSIKHDFTSEKNLIIKSATTIDIKYISDVFENTKISRGNINTLSQLTSDAIKSTDQEDKIHAIDYLFSDIKKNFRLLIDNSKYVVSPVYYAPSIIKQIKNSYYSDDKFSYYIDGVGFSYTNAIVKIYNSMSEINQFSYKNILIKKLGDYLFTKPNYLTKHIDSLSESVFTTHSREFINVPSNHIAKINKHSTTQKHVTNYGFQELAKFENLF